MSLALSSLNDGPGWTLAIAAVLAAVLVWWAVRTR